MAFKTFTIPVCDPEAAERDLNAFLRSHRILTVSRRWVDLGSSSFWAVWVDFLESHPAGSMGTGNNVSRGKVDYRDKLKPEDFDVFVQMRQLRTQLAQEDGVPLYRVMTNDQMSQMIEDRVRTKADLARITGFGEARAEKYGTQLLDFLNRIWESASETGGKPAGTDH